MTENNRKTESSDSGEFSNSRLGSDHALTNTEESPEILFGNELLEIVRAAHMLTDVIEQIGNRVQKIEDRLEDADLEDMTDRLEIVEDADADNRCWQVESDLDELDTRVGELEEKEEKSHD